MIATAILFTGLLETFPSLPSSTPTPGVTSPPSTSQVSLDITELNLTKEVLSLGEQTQLTVHAKGSALTYRWSAEYGAITPNDWGAQSTAQYTAPDFTTVDTVQVTVRDQEGNIETAEENIQVVNADSTVSPQSGPQITAPLRPTKKVLGTGEQTEITVEAIGKTLTYRWSADYGTVEPGDWCINSTVLYTAPDSATVDTVTVTVRDESDNKVTASVRIQVVVQE
jgi:hypothetical protein